MNSDLHKSATEAYLNGKYTEMVYFAKAALDNNENDDYAYYLIAVGEKAIGNLESASLFAQKAIALNPAASNARLMLATIWRQMGEINKAEAEFLQLRIEFPDHEVVASNYGYMLNDLKRFNESLELLKPFADSGNLGEAIAINIGNAYRGLGELENAKFYYEYALKLDGKYQSGAKANLAVIALEEGKLSEARSGLIDLVNNGSAPQEAFLNLGIIASRLEKTEEAIKWICKGEAMGLDSLSATAVYALAQAKLGNFEDAIKKIRKHINNNNFDFMLLCVWLGIAQKNCLFNELREARSKIISAIKNRVTTGVSEINLFGLLACEGISPWQHLELAKKSAKRILRDRKPIELNPRRKNRIRIGYLCADFRDHPVAHLMIGVFKNHDRARFEIYGYNIGPFDDTIYRYRSIAYLDHFVEAAEMGFEQLANRIAADEIDILVDLVGYTENCKPQTLFYKPSPIIVSYLGFVGTTGMDVVDYIIADDIVLPSQYESAFTEKPIYLPRCYQATDGTLLMESVTREELGLPEGKFVFVSLNNAYKLNDRFLSLWAQILHRCPDSVIWLLASSPSIRKNVVDELDRLSIDPSRIFFFERQSKARFLGALACADLFLDSSPYNAGTTASDALYAGCPVITLPGEIYAARMAASIVTHAGLPELVCKSAADYLEKAIRIYTDAPYRESIRFKALQAKETRLFDATDATRCLEEGFVAAYERYWAGHPPAPLRISDEGWVRDESHQRPFAGYQLTAEEVELIEQKLGRIDGEQALAHFRQLVSPLNAKPALIAQNIKRELTTPTATPALPLVASEKDDNGSTNFEMSIPPMNENEKVLNFFNPVFWGVKDPEIFADLMRIAAKQTTAYHFADNMFVFQRNNSMLHDQQFMTAWQQNAVSTNDKAIIWRRYIKVIAGFHCSHLEGDFVECGAYQGTGAKTVIDYLGGPAFPKTFWLYDMFEHNEQMVNHSMPGHGPQLYDEVCNRFVGYPNVKVLKGFLPDVLKEGCPEKIAYLHIDLNQAPAEIASLEALFEKVVPGGMIILDDYEMFYYRAQKYAEDDWFGKRGYKIFPLPTSQGFVIKR